MTNSSQIIINLQDSQTRVDELRRVLDQVNLVTDSKKMLKVFDGVKESLLKVVSSIDQIINFDSVQVEKNYAQAQSVQVLANQIQKNLFEGRMKIHKLPSNVYSLITEKSEEEISKLMICFSELQDLYETQIKDDHLSFERLAVPEVETLFSQAAFFGLKKLNRSIVFAVLRDYLAVDSVSPGFEQDTQKYKPIAEKYFPMFTNLTKGLFDEVSLIANDISKFDTVLIEAQKSLYLEAFRLKVASLLNADFNLTELIKATKDDAEYMRLIGRVLDRALVDDSLSIVDLTKTLLTLQALRLRESKDDLQLLNDEKMLGFNDKRPVQDKLHFLATMVIANQYINQVELLPGAFETSKKFYDPLVTARKALSNDSDLNLTIAQLKKEFANPKTQQDAKPKSQSEFSRFYEENKILFIKFGIKKKDFLALRDSSDNTLLRALLEKITTKTKQNSSIHYKQAAKFAYVLAKVFVKEPKIEIISFLQGIGSRVNSLESLISVFLKMKSPDKNNPIDP